MKSSKQPPFGWLQKHVDDPEAVSKYLPEFLLAESYSPVVLAAAREKWDTLPFYITQSLDSQIIALIKNPVADMQTALNRYWVTRAVSVLRGYADCPVPFSKDKRVIGPRRDLLSPKGHNRLCFLEYALHRKQFTQQTVKIAQEAAQKAGLDLDLFLDVSHLSALCKKRYGGVKNIDVSMTNGCYNGCVHCGYDAKAPVSHMPYPLFLKISQKVYQDTRPKGLWYMYTDSDPITYQDPIINADSGDVVLAMNALLNPRNPSYISCVTKGVLTKRDEIAFGKMVHNASMIHEDRKTDYRPIMGLDISLVDLPGEAFHKNFERVKRTAEICVDIDPNTLIALRYYGIKNHVKMNLELFDTLPKEITVEHIWVTGFDALGRWPQTVRDLKEKGITVDEPKTLLTDDRYVIGADLMVYDTYRSGEKIIWQPLCSVLDTEFMKRLAKPKRMHPTVAADKKPPKHWLRRLFGGRDRD